MGCPVPHTTGHKCSQLLFCHHTVRCEKLPQACVSGVGVTGEGGGAQGVWHEEQRGGDTDGGVGGVMGRRLVAKMNWNAQFNSANREIARLTIQ